MTPRWTDDRLDDMAETVRTNTRRLDDRTVKIDRLERDARDRRRTREQRDRHEWTLYMLLLTILATQLAHLIT